MTKTKAKRRIKNWIKNNDPDQILDLSKLGLKFLPNLPNNLRRLDCSRNQLTQLPDLPHCLRLDCSDNQYLYITKEIADKFHLRETPNYVLMIKPIQTRWKARFRLLKLRRLQRHIDAFRYRLHSIGFKELANKYASIML